MIYYVFINNDRQGSSCHLAVFKNMVPRYLLTKSQTRLGPSLYIPPWSISNRRNHFYETQVLDPEGDGTGAGLVEPFVMEGTNHTCTHISV